MNEQMGDPLIRLAGRTLGLLPVLQPRLLSMFAAEESPEESPAGSPPAPNSGGAGGLCDRSILPLTRLPRSLMSAIVDPLASPPGTGIPLAPLGRGDRKGGDLEQNLELGIQQSAISFTPNSLEGFPLKVGRDEREQALTLYTSDTASVPIALTPLETPKDTLGEPIGTAQPNPVIDSTPSQPFANNISDEGTRDLEFVTVQNSISINPNPSASLIQRKPDDRPQQALDSGLRMSSNPIAQPTLETPIRDAVGEPIVLSPPHPGMNSGANSQNLLKQVKEEIIAVPQSVSTDLRYEPRNSFRGGPETQQNASLNSGSLTPQPFANNTLDDRSQDLEFVTIQNSTSISPNSSESLIRRKPDDRSQQMLELELRTTSTPIARPTSETLADAVGEPIGIVQPNPAINSHANRQNQSKQVENKIIHDPQSVSTDFGYEPRNSFRGGPTTQQNTSLETETSTTQPSTNKPVNDRSQDLEFVTVQNSTSISPHPSEKTLRDAIGESIGTVQRNPSIKAQPNPIIPPATPSNPASPIEPIAEILDEIREFSQSLKVPLPKGDLGGSGSAPTTNYLSYLEPDILAIRPPAPNSGGAGNVTRNQTTIAITIGRISVRGVPPAAPPPSRSTRSHRPQVSLNDYLKARNGGNG